jgi:chromosome segregation protein
MRLKSLTLNGYKTFATKAQFEFGAGITCIIGPNGSGKSNIADGIRWALGEQQFSLLRGKRTDDMIFSGSAKRPRAGMAEVILTFDNSDGFFPVAFNDIEIGRRAFRDGSNEYILNNNRVRLRDVGDLLSHSGLAERTYTVIGQGLVDNALAQKPEERRALFEEAAGIASYRDRREDALRKLDETRHNLERAADILAEITPRVGSLERQAGRARQYQTLKAELDELTKQYFGFYHRRVLKSIADTTASRDKAQQTAAEALATVNAFDAEAESLRQRRLQLRAHAAEILPRRDAARNAGETALRNLAVMRERVTAAESQIARAQRDLDDYAASLDALNIRANEATMLIAAARATFFSKLADLEQAQSTSSSDREAKEQLEQQRAAARQSLISISASAVGTQRQIDAARQRQLTLRAQIESLSQRAEQIGRQRDAEIARRDQLAGAIDGDARQTNLFDAQFDEATAELQRSGAAVSAAQSALAAAEAEEKLTARFTLFSDMRAQQTADDLAQSLMSAGIPHVQGMLNSFIQVLPDDQKAVEAALGDLLHAVIVSGSTHEESAESLNRVRAWLTEQGSGRLAVIPDTLREIDEERQKQDQALTEHARSRGARPLLDSIQAPDALRPVLQLIAGGAFIARDLEAARDLAVELVDGCVVVTRDGEAALPVGALTLPAGARSPLILGAEADAPELVEVDKLPDPEAARQNRERAQQALDFAQREFDAAKAVLDNSLRARDMFARETITRKAMTEEIGRKVERFEENLAALIGEIQQAEGEIEGIDAQVSSLEADLERQQEAQGRAQQDVQDIESMLTAVMAGGWFEAVNSAQNALALSRAVMQSNEQVVYERLTARAGALTQRAAREQRVNDATAQRDRAQSELTALTAAASEAQAALRATEDELAPVQQQIGEVEQQLGEHDARRRESERALREAESRLNTIALELARNNDALEAMRTRAAEMIAEGETASPESRVPSPEPETAATGMADSGLATQDSGPSAVELFLTSLPEVEALPEGLEDRLNQLRGQIKRLGAINFEAQAEYEELKKRHDFITEQSADLTQASEQLRQVIAELNDVIKVTFRQTFDAINEAFQNTFKVLFGGGQAKLTLVNPDNIDECGVEILAQPPGKRPQSLALLSGGERSLTATSLLFAILQVKPTPFCVLDEVDAALDESNVGRFRAMVESLSDQTQFIIITHNRRTVEAATTIYGISMGADGASTSLSLRLDEVK